MTKYCNMYVILRKKRIIRNIIREKNKRLQKNNLS